MGTVKDALKSPEAVVVVVVTTLVSHFMVIVLPAGM